MRGPQIEKLMETFNLNKIEAKVLKDYMTAGQYKKALTYLNLKLDAYGVESLYPEYPDIWYVNRGETYETTLLYTGKSFIISSWGDWVENHNPVSNDGSNPRNPKYLK